jgi:hypothetical protein
MRFFKRRIALVGLAAGVALATAAGVAFAVFPTDTVTHYTGCLNTSASPGGTFVNVAQGETPSKPCGKGQVIAHLSGGDITNVQTASGSGLSGGTDNGAASLALDSSGCSSGGILKWNGSTWTCGIDENGGGTITGVQAGTGLTGGGTSGSVSLGIDGGYQLPQNCGNGQVPKSDGSNGWSCQSDQTGATDIYSSSNDSIPGVLSDDAWHSVISLSLPAGSFLVYGKGTVGDSDRDAFVGCDLMDGSTSLDHGGAETTDVQDQEFFDTSPVTLSAPTTLDIACRTTEAGVQVFDLKMEAIRATNLH